MSAEPTERAGVWQLEVFTDRYVVVRQGKPLAPPTWQWRLRDPWGEVAVVSRDRFSDEATARFAALEEQMYLRETELRP